MTDYLNASIYVIYSKNPKYPLYYIGSTKKTLEERMYIHKSNFIGWKNGNKHNRFCSSFFLALDNFGFNNLIIEKIIDYPCLSKEELKDAEDIIINMYDNLIDNYILCNKQKKTMF